MALMPTASLSARKSASRYSPEGPPSWGRQARSQAFGSLGAVRLPSSVTSVADPLLARTSCLQTQGSAQTKASMKRSSATLVRGFLCDCHLGHQLAKKICSRRQLSKPRLQRQTPLRLLVVGSKGTATNDRAASQKG